MKEQLIHIYSSFFYFLLHVFYLHFFQLLLHVSHALTLFRSVPLHVHRIIIQSRQACLLHQSYIYIYIQTNIYLTFHPSILTSSTLILAACEVVSFSSVFLNPFDNLYLKKGTVICWTQILHNNIITGLISMDSYY